MKRYPLIFLFVLLLLSTSIFGQNELSKKEVKDLVEQYFIIKDVPIRYYSNILIRIDGAITPEDSLFVTQLINKLNTYIDKWEVSLISERTSNLILSVNKPQSENYPQERFGNRNQVEIIRKREPVNLSEGMTQAERNKIFYYKIMKNLVKLYKVKEVSTIIPKTVFVLDKPEEVVTNNPVDFQIIQEIYLKEYDNKLDARPVKPVRAPSRTRQILIIASMLSTTVSTLFLLWMFHLGVFKNHNYIFSEYFKQGMLVLFASTVGILISIFIPTFFMITYMSEDKIHTIVPLIASALAMIISGTIILLIIYFLEYLILKKNKTLFLQVIIPFLTTSFVPSSLFFFLITFVSSKTSATLPTIDKQNSMLTILGITMSIAIYRAFFIFLTKKSESIINQKDVELARMSELHRKAELQSLRAKINPHFLYNSLNSIASLASIDSKKTEQMALSLSDFFKYSINREQKQTNPLSEELKAVETYLEIEKVRFGDRLTYSIECPDSLKSVQIPQLLIQPLVENAVKHGISKLLKDGVIQIVVSALESEQISIRVYDNGPDFPSGPMSGFGIRNTHERLQLLYDDKASMNWKNQPEKYFELIFPQQPSPRSFKPMQHSIEIPNYTQPKQTGKSRMRKLMNTIWVIAAFLVMAGALFRIQHYPHGNLLLAIGLTSGLLMAILEGVRQMITTKDNE